MSSGLSVYIASGLDNRVAVQRLADALRERGHSISYDWSVHGSVHDVALTPVENVFRMSHAAVRELEGVRDADIVVVLFPCGRGTHLEFGAALALKRPVVVATDPKHIAVLRPVSFYYHPLVERIELEDEEQLVRAVVKTVDLHRSRAAVARG